MMTADRVPTGMTATKTILIVDDDPIICEIASEVLADAGFRVVCVDNGEDAIDVAWEEAPDAVLLDCSLPGKPGMVVLDQFRKSARFGAIPIAMLTARRSVWSETISCQKGANAYIRKPFDPVDLLTEVARLTR